MLCKIEKKIIISQIDILNLIFRQKSPVYKLILLHRNFTLSAISKIITWPFLLRKINVGICIVLFCIIKIIVTMLKSIYLIFQNMRKKLMIKIDWNQSYTNADLKICQYLRLHIKVICRRFCIKKLFPFWDTHTSGMWKVCLQTFRNNRIC